MIGFEFQRLNDRFKQYGSSRYPEQNLTKEGIQVLNTVNRTYCISYRLLSMNSLIKYTAQEHKYMTLRLQGAWPLPFALEPLNSIGGSRHRKYSRSRGGTYIQGLLQTSSEEDSKRIQAFNAYT